MTSFNPHNILKSIQVDLDGILQPISESDFNLFKSNMNNVSYLAPYSSSWLYINQACRGLLYRYNSDNIFYQ